METSLDTRRDGYNVKRLREILGMKQEELADKINLTQQTVSKIESKNILEDDLLKQIAEALHVPVEAIKNFNEAAAVNIIANTFNSNDNSAGLVAQQYNFNPIDKIIELYERMLKAEQEKVALLEEVLKGKK
jgi:transcriptional regulator with XRE-family HTH domain